MYSIDEYYMICNDEGSAYGGFESLDDAIESFNEHDFLNNDNHYNQIKRVIELTEVVFKAKDDILKQGRI